MALGTDSQQQMLPLAEAEASHAERWNNLGLALGRIPRRHQTAQLAQLVRWVFNVTKGGLSGALTKPYAELGQWPWGLCCSERTARRTVASAQRLGLLSVTDQRRWDGSQQPNAYAIDWDGVRSLIRGDATDGHTDHPPGHSGHHPGQIGRHIRNYSLLQSSIRKTSGPDRGPTPAPEGNFFSTKTTNDTNFDRAGNNQTLAELLCADSPILSEAAGRLIAPLPASGLVHGVYAPIRPVHLGQPLRLVEWHRRQLSTAVPVMGNSEADLLLTLATALFAASLPERDIRKSRVAAFVSTINKRQWHRSLSFVPEARKLLDAALARGGIAIAGLAAQLEEARAE